MEKVELTVASGGLDEVYLEEWLYYNWLMGVRRFVLCDNGSKVSFSERLPKAMASGLVVEIKKQEVEDFPARGGAPYYDLVLTYFRETTTWLGFYDLDEFPVLAYPGELTFHLNDYLKYGGVGLNWMVYGSSNLKTRPEGAALCHYTRRLANYDPINQHIKQIVQPTAVLSSGGNPHSFLYRSGIDPVGEDFETLPVFGNAPRKPPTHQRMWFNHYLTRSWEDWQDRTRKTSSTPGMFTRPDSEFVYYQNNSETEDTVILDWLSWRLRSARSDVCTAFNLGLQQFIWDQLK